MPVLILKLDYPNTYTSYALFYTVMRLRDRVHPRYLLLYNAPNPKHVYHTTIKHPQWGHSLNKEQMSWNQSVR